MTTRLRVATSGKQAIAEDIAANAIAGKVLTVVVEGVELGVQWQNGTLSVIFPDGTIVGVTDVIPQRFVYSSSLCVTPEMFGADHILGGNDAAAFRAAAEYVDAQGGGTVICSGNYYGEFNATGLSHVTFECEGAIFTQPFNAGSTLPILDFTGSTDCVLRNARFVGMAFTQAVILLARGAPATGFNSCNRNRVENAEYSGVCAAACLVMHGCEDTTIIGGKLYNQYGAGDSRGALQLGNTDSSNVTSHIARLIGNASTIRNNIIDVKFAVGVTLTRNAQCITIIGTPEYRFDGCGTYSSDNLTPIDHFKYVGTDAHAARGTITGHMFEGPGNAVFLANAGGVNSYYQHITVEDCSITQANTNWVEVQDATIIAMSWRFRNNSGAGALHFSYLTQSDIDAGQLVAGAGTVSTVTIDTQCTSTRIRAMPGAVTLPLSEWLRRDVSVEVAFDGVNYFGMGQVERQIILELQDRYGAANVTQVVFPSGAAFNVASHCIAVTVLLGPSLIAEDASQIVGNQYHGRCVLTSPGNASGSLHEATLAGPLSALAIVDGSSGGTVAFETLFESAVAPRSSGILMRDNLTANFLASTGAIHYVDGKLDNVIPTTDVHVLEGVLAANAQVGSSWLGNDLGGRGWIGSLIAGRTLAVEPTDADRAWELQLWQQYISLVKTGGQ